MLKSWGLPWSLKITLSCSLGDYSKQKAENQFRTRLEMGMTVCNGNSNENSNTHNNDRGGNHKSGNNGKKQQ